MHSANAAIKANATGLAERGAGALAFAKTLWPALLVLAAAIIRQACGHLNGDVSWLITTGEEILDGKIAYVDFIETNPPAAIFIYVPAIVAARLSGATPEFMVGLFCFAGVVASLALSGLILRSIALAQNVSPVALIGALAVLALLPAHDFAQREHVAVIFGLPFFSALAVRAEGEKVGIALRLIAGIGAGAMASIKPHFALMIVAVLPYFVWRAGWKEAAASLEVYVAAAVAALHAAIIVIFFPAYVENISRLALAIYVPVQSSWFDLARGAAFSSWLVLVAYLVAAAREKICSPLVATPALASCGAMLAYFIQSKGWGYQSYPAIALMAMATLLAAAHGEDAMRRFAPGVFCLAAVLAAGAIAPTARLGLALMTAPIGASAILVGLFSGAAARRRGETAEISTLALGFVGAVLWTWFDFRDNRLSFEAKAAALTAHPKVMMISDDLNVGFPFVRRIGGVWSQRTNMLWITACASWRIQQSGDDPAVVAEMKPYLTLDRNMLVEDIRRNRPDMILISNRLEKFRDWAFADPAIGAELTNYRLYDEDPALKTFLYVRADLIALRSTLNEASALASNGAR